MNRLFMEHKFHTSKQWFFFLTLIASTVSCSKTSHQEQKVNEVKVAEKKVYSKPPSSFSDTVSVNYPTAVFYNSDSIQLLKIKAVTDKMIFEGTMHDCFYQMRNARLVLKQHYPKVIIKEIEKARFIFFKKVNGINEIVDLNTKNDPCGLFVFDGHKSPQLVDMTNVDTELNFYFSKK